jgi:hypothetical protein
MIQAAMVTDPLQRFPTLGSFLEVRFWCFAVSLCLDSQILLHRVNIFDKAASTLGSTVRWYGRSWPYHWSLSLLWTPLRIFFLGLVWVIVGKPLVLQIIIILPIYGTYSSGCKSSSLFTWWCETNRIGVRRHIKIWICRWYFTRPCLYVEISYSCQANTSIVPLNDVKNAHEYIMCIIRALHIIQMSFHIIKWNDISRLHCPVEYTPYKTCLSVVNVCYHRNSCSPILPYS